MSASNLQWVHGEILARMNEARLAVEAHAAESDNHDAIVRCCELVTQIHRVLIVVGVHGPALLVEEMGALARGMEDGTVNVSVDAHEALMRSLIDLAGYLDRLRSGWREHPLDLLQMVNDLRSARGRELLSPGALFAPPLWVELPENAVTLRRQRREFSVAVHRLRRLYQTALLALLRAPEQREYEYLQRIDEILERVEQIAANRPALRLWWVARAMVQSLANADLEFTVACKRMLGQLDRALKTLMDGGEAALDDDPPAEMLRHLLYYAASSPAESARTAEVKDAFGLRELMGGFDNDASVGGHIAALSAVAVPLNAALIETEEKLSCASSPGDDAQWNSEVAANVRQLSVTLGLLGINDLRTQLEARAAQVAGAAELQSTDQSKLFLDLAQDLIGTRAIIGALNDPSAKGIPNASDIAELRYREARLHCVAQLRNELFAVKEQLTEFALTPGSVELLPPTVKALGGCLGVLRVISPRGASVALRAWISEVEVMSEDALASIDRPQLEEVAGLIIGLESSLDDVDASDTPEDVATVLLRPPVETPATTESARPDLELVTSSDAANAEQPSITNPLGFDQAMDDELLGIFTDEVAEVIETLNDHVPVWQADLSHRGSLLEIRRAFHTLKGSGRVVGANEVGDFAWSIESVLNRVIDGVVRPSSDIARVVEEGTALLPQVLEALRAQGAVPEDISDVQARAERLVA